MSQPPYPPQGGDEPGGERSGSPGWGGADDPTRQFDSPADGGQRQATRQFGQPSYEQPVQSPYGPPQYGPPPGQATYPQPGPPQYGSSQYGPSQYGPAPGQGSYPQPGQAPYGGYGQPPYGQPWGPPGGPGGPRPKTSRNTVIALVVGAVLVLAAIGAGVFFLLRAADPGPGAGGSGGFASGSGGASEPAPTGDDGIPAATVTPDGLGDDPDLDELAQECFDGDMDSCDRLYEEAELDSLYGLYGGTCAGRQDVSAADTVFCSDAFPGG